MVSVGEGGRAATRWAVGKAVEVTLLLFVLIFTLMFVFVLVLVFVLLLLFLVLMMVMVVMVMVLGGGRGGDALLSEGRHRCGWHGHNCLLHDRRLSACGGNIPFFPINIQLLFFFYLLMYNTMLCSAQPCK